jgi:hypothetical protein
VPLLKCGYTEYGITTHCATVTACVSERGHDDVRD